MRYKSSIKNIFIDGLSLGCIGINKDYQIIVYNNWMEKHSGLKADEIIGKSIYDVFPDIQQRNKDIFLKNAIENQIPSILSPLIHQYFISLEITKNDLTIPMIQEARIYPFNIENESIVAMIFIKDLTEQILYQKTLQESEKLLKKGEQVASTGSFHIDLVENKLIWSEQMFRMMGYNPGECKPTYLRFIRHVHSDDRQKVNKLARAAINEKVIFDIEFLIIPKNSKKIIVHAVADIEYDEKGNANYIYGIFQDITKRKTIENDLLESKKNAQAANIAKDQFLANMSHEIRTPLSGIVGIIDMLMSMYSDEELKRNLELIKTSSLSLVKIVNDILDISKIEADNLVISSEEFNIKTIIERCIQSFALELQKKGLKAHSQIDEYVPKELIGDPNRLTQVLTNLIGNAIKFTDHGEIVICVENTSKTNKFLFSVQDTGIGIPEYKKTKLFKNFSQLDLSYSKKYSGVGLGLAISKKLVEMMGGRIWIESNENAGSTFYFTVNLKAYESDVSNKNVIIKPEINKYEINRTLTILFIEDDPIIQKSATYFLEKAGYKVVVANDGQAGLNLLINSKFDLILMDVQMPGMDGLTTTKHIRRSESSYSNIPIIAMTAYAMKGDRAKFLNAGMDDYLSKPFSTDTLLKKIKEYESIIV